MLSLWAIQVWSVFKCRSIAKFEHTEISNVHVSKSFLIILFSWAKEEVPGDVHLQAGAGDGEGLILPQSLVLIACEVRASNLLSQVSINLTLRDFIFFFFFYPEPIYPKRSSVFMILKVNKSVPSEPDLGLMFLEAFGGEKDWDYRFCPLCLPQMSSVASHLLMPLTST